MQHVIPSGRTSRTRIMLFMSWEFYDNVVGHMIGGRLICGMEPLRPEGTMPAILTKYEKLAYYFKG